MEKELQLQGTLCHTQDPASPAGLHITNSFLTPASFYMAEGGIPGVFGFLAHCLLFISFPSVLLSLSLPPSLFGNYFPPPQILARSTISPMCMGSMPQASLLEPGEGTPGHGRTPVDSPWRLQLPPGKSLPVGKRGCLTPVSSKPQLVRNSHPPPIPA